jgi:hypothetical protein
MRRILAIIPIVIFASCVSDTSADVEERRIDYAAYIDAPTTVEYDSENYNFGEVTDGDIVKHSFKFTNTGETNLVLIDVTGSCGCTVPENWPKEPIPPGGTGQIDVEFNTHGKVGNTTKSVSVEANTNPTVTKLYITGKVNKKAN